MTAIDGDEKIKKHIVVALWFFFLIVNNVGSLGIVKGLWQAWLAQELGGKLLPSIPQTKLPLR